MNRARVYCAGPLFNPRERDEMEELAAELEGAGFRTFLPQRDGLELVKLVPELTARGFSHPQATEMASKAIFALDVYQVVKGCQAVVANLNGRVPDEGAVSEAAIAWAWGRIVVGYKSDSRSLILGQDNPLVVGLFGFRLCRTPSEVVAVLREALRSHASPVEVARNGTRVVGDYLRLGEEISAAAEASAEARIRRVAEVLARQVGSCVARTSGSNGG